MLTTRFLTTDDDLSTFSAAYERLAMTSVDLAYLRGADQVRAFFVGGRMVGGCVFNSRGELRYLSALPADAFPAELDRDAFFECTCIWFERELGTVARLVAYFVLFVDFVRCDHRYVLGGSLVPKVARHQRSALPHVIYEGMVQVHGVERWGSVYYGTLATATVAFIRTIGKRTWRGVTRLLRGEGRKVRSARANHPSTKHSSTQLCLVDLV